MGSETLCSGIGLKGSGIGFAGMYDWTATLRKRIAVIRAASALRAAAPRGGQDRDGTGGPGWDYCLRAERSGSLAQAD
jgi:hypothetical protein